MRAVSFSALLFALAFFGLWTAVHAQADCTDFLTFNYKGQSKLPADAFDYNTSVASLRVISGRLDGFHFQDGVSTGYLYAAVAPYDARNVSAGSILYQYTPGATDYYYRVLNGSAVPWYCDSGKMADLRFSAVNLSGLFLEANATVLNLTQTHALALDAGIADGFWIPNFGTVSKLFVVADPNVTAIENGYILFDAGNGTFIETGFKQARFHVPANRSLFCMNVGSSCLDYSGIHAAYCQGHGLVAYACNANACVSNLTACRLGCQSGACVQPTATPGPTAVVLQTNASSPAASNPARAVRPASSEQPGGGLGWSELLIPLAVILAAAYYVFGMKRKPRGL